jgi:hypothetical protein
MELEEWLKNLDIITTTETRKSYVTYSHLRSMPLY